MTAIAAQALETIQQMAASDWTDPTLHPATKSGLIRVRMEAWRKGDGTSNSAAKAAQHSASPLTGLLMEGC